MLWRRYLKYQTVIFIMDRRTFIQLGLIAGSAVAAGCMNVLQDDPDNPESLGLWVHNRMDDDIEIDIKVKSESESVYETKTAVSPNDTVEKETSLQETKYTVTANYTINNEEYITHTQEWEWRGCIKDKISITIKRAGVDIGNQCYDD